MVVCYLFIFGTPPFRKIKLKNNIIKYIRDVYYVKIQKICRNIIEKLVVDLAFDLVSAVVFNFLPLGFSSSSKKSFIHTFDPVSLQI